VRKRYLTFTYASSYARWVHKNPKLRLEIHQEPLSGCLGAVDAALEPCPFAIIAARSICVLSSVVLSAVTLAPHVVCTRLVKLRFAVAEPSSQHLGNLVVLIPSTSSQHENDAKPGVDFRWRSRTKRSMTRRFWSCNRVFWTPPSSMCCRTSSREKLEVLLRSS